MAPEHVANGPSLTRHAVLEPKNMARKSPSDSQRPTNLFLSQHLSILVPTNFGRLSINHCMIWWAKMSRDLSRDHPSASLSVEDHFDYLSQYWFVLSAVFTTLLLLCPAIYWCIPWLKHALCLPQWQHHRHHHQSKTEKYSGRCSTGCLNVVCEHIVQLMRVSSSVPITSSQQFFYLRNSVQSIRVKNGAKGAQVCERCTEGHQCIVHWNRECALTIKKVWWPKRQILLYTSKTRCA